MFHYLLSFLMFFILSSSDSDSLQIDQENALDYTKHSVCDDYLITDRDKSSNLNLGVTDAIKDCTQKNITHTVKALRLRSGFIANDGFKYIIKEFSDPNFLTNIEVLDISFSRANKDIFNDGDFKDSLIKTLSRNNLKFLDICGSYFSGSEELKKFFSILENKNDFLKIIWIHKGHLDGLVWTNSLDSNKTIKDYIRLIKFKHYEYYDKLKINYNDDFKLSKEENEIKNSKDNIKIKKEDWNNFLNNIKYQGKTCEETEDSAFKWLVEFSRDDEDKEETIKSRLELAKHIKFPFNRSDSLPSQAARIFHTIAYDLEAPKLIRGEAAYHLSEIRKIGLGLPCDVNESKELFNISQECGYNSPSLNFRSTERKK